jgi:hypothetical protein
MQKSLLPRRQRWEAWGSRPAKQKLRRTYLKNKLERIPVIPERPRKGGFWFKVS